ncbi:hypothetical protein PP175_23230 [Aneurinibacillus sp. Ricciae_BoGa-3]|uniref:hypothetical protein n=1 Tax=Aneurinibacillus sp. Ricciae_BoGa-3 TaxID=3022697 RepID=UPI0023401B2F|nr:hypothetical protein [Aneurinibacillus sp. Ricciae_BoGa-3]WCK54166.1 hypothetical protein PP175_23230 [Aneurinibacillus sp. Ricciae_BoGa-3]
METKLYESLVVQSKMFVNGIFEDGEEINFSTSGVYRGSINESDIKIIKVMKKIFI